MSIPQRHRYEQARKANLRRELEQAREAEAFLADLPQQDEEPAREPLRLASERLYKHKAASVISDVELVRVVRQRAHANADDALYRADDPYEALLQAGWEQDCYLTSMLGQPEGPLDLQLIHLIRHVMNVEASGDRYKAQVLALAGLRTIAIRLTDYITSSESGQKVALDELYDEHRDRAEVALMDAAGV